MTLDEIGILHKTDKSSKKHNYLAVYEQVLQSMRDKPIKLLEIGIFNGASLRMWRDYFPQGKIVGVDNKPQALEHAGERIEVYHGDQADPDGLIALATKHGPFDVIIDDGSHIWWHQIATMRALLPLVRSGGHYILEDLHTSFGEYVPNYGVNSKETAASFCFRFAERVLADRALKLDPEPDPFLAAAPQLVSKVLIANRTAIFYRK